MSLIKKIIFIAFAFAAIGFGVFGYFKLKNIKKPIVDAVSFLPDSCLIYINTNNFSDLNIKLNSQSLIADRLFIFKEIGFLCQTIRGIDSLFNTDELLKEELADKTIHFAIYNQGFDWISTFNINELGNQSEIQKNLTKLFSAKEIEKGVFKFNLNKQKEFFFTLNAGVVVLANNKPGLLSAINPLRIKLKNNVNFLGYKNSAEEGAAISFFINHNLYGASAANKKLNLSDFCSQGISYGTIDILPSEISINGYLNTGANDYKSALFNQEPASADFFNALPYNTSSFVAFGLSSFLTFKNNLLNQINDPNKNYWRQLNDSALYNLESDFYKNIAGNLFEFETEISKQNYVGLKIEDSLLAKEQLKLMSDSVYKEKATSIYFLIKNNSLGPLQLFYPIIKCETKYASYYDGFLFFAENQESLLKLLSTLKSGLLLSKDESFLNYKNQNFPETFNYLAYSSLQQNKNKSYSIFNFTKNSEDNPFENFKHFSLAITNETKNFKFRCHLMYEVENNHTDNSGLWTLKLDTTCHKKAAVFLNHITKENELVVQDDGNTIYLINAKGTLLWKKKIAEEITSNFFTVDAFKNKKNQLLFSSKNYLHLLDRNGKYIDGYPVKLPSEASSALSVFDYDQNKDYRLFIACKNKHIYNYTINGVQQKGFTAIKTEKEVRLAMQYIQVGQSDYLVCVDVDGKIYISSRKGEARINLKYKAKKNCAAFYLEASNSLEATNLFYLNDERGQLSKISFADKETNINLHQELIGASCEFLAIDENKNTDLIATSGSGFYAFDLSGHLLYEQNGLKDLVKTQFYSDETSAFYYSSKNNNETLIFNTLKGKKDAFKSTSVPLICKLFNDEKKYFIISYFNEISARLVD